MNPIRAFYDSLPEHIRTRFRSYLPDDILRWYSHKNTDVYLISYPKCGRTWLRLMIGRVFIQYFSLPENEDTLLLRRIKRPHPDMPMITIVHDDRPMLKAPHELEESKSRYRDKKVIFMVRDPRDVIVSSYFEMRNRGYLFGNNPYEKRKAIFEGSLSEFIQRKEGGFDTILEYYNIWAKNQHIPKGFLLVRYEDLRANPNRELLRVLEFLGLSEVPAEVIQDAIDYASFDNMRKMEVEGKFQNSMLKPADINNSDSFKTRKGKVKGYLDNLTEKEIADLSQILKSKLSKTYGYSD